MYSGWHRFFNTEQHDNLVSISHGRYDDMRMAWVGRPNKPRVFAITDVSSLISAVCEDRVWISIQNVDAGNYVWLGFGSAGVVNESLRLAPGQTLILDKTMPWRESIHAICNTGLTATLLVNDVHQSDIRGGRGA
jgi:hypothetical protein